jgi:hypothetical protein
VSTSERGIRRDSSGQVAQITYSSALSSSWVAAFFVGLRGKEDGSEGISGEETDFGI